MFKVASLDVAGGGRLGIAPMPGMSAPLEDDLATIVAWNPSVVVSLTEREEMETAGVAVTLGERLGNQGMAWMHFPIPDFGVPDDQGKTLWPSLSQALHVHLDRAGGVLLHCHGGRGRSGMVALRLLVERGEGPAGALARLRVVRPGAVETAQQMA